MTVFILSIVLSKGSSTWIMASFGFDIAYIIVDTIVVAAKERRKRLENFEYRPQFLSKPQAWEEEAQRRWVAPPLSEGPKRFLSIFGFPNYTCGICGCTYLTRKGVSNCCQAAKAAGVKENPLIQMYGRSSITPHMRPTTTVTGMGYPGQFDHLSGYHRPR